VARATPRDLQVIDFLIRAADSNAFHPQQFAAEQATLLHAAGPIPGFASLNPGYKLTKALAEANRAAFAIKSARDAGTLVEITFPGTRVLAE